MSTSLASSVTAAALASASVVSVSAAATSVTSSILLLISLILALFKKGSTESPMIEVVTRRCAAVILVALFLCGSTISAAAAESTADICSTSLWVAGYNEYGQFGTGTASVGNTNSTFIPIGTFEGGGLLDVATGSSHSILVKADGTAWTTGYNGISTFLGGGRLGHGDALSRSAFTRVEGVQNIVKVAGHTNTFFISGIGEVFATGKNGNGQLGVGDTTDRFSPVKVPINDVVDVAAHAWHTIFLKSDGTAYATGWNGNGQLCLGDDRQQTTSPVRIDALSDVVQIAAGFRHTAFLTGAGTAWTCGSNFWGQLGLADNANRNAPTQVSRFLSSAVTSVAAYYDSTAFLLADGAVQSTGNNKHGQLGVGDNVTRNEPVVVPIDDVTDIYATRGYQLFFRRADGTVWSAGENLYGELGVGDTSDRNSPAEVSTLVAGGGSLSYVAGGYSFSIFVAHEPCTKTPSSTPTDMPTSSGSPTAEPSTVPSIKPTQGPSAEPSNSPSFGIASETEGYFQQSISFHSSKLNSQERDIFKDVLMSLTGEYGAGEPLVRTTAAILGQEEISSERNRRTQRRQQETEERVQMSYFINYESRYADVSNYPHEFEKYMSIEVNRRDFEKRLEEENIQVVLGSAGEALMVDPPSQSGQTPPSSSSGSSAGLIIGIVVAIVGVLGAAGLYLRRRQHKKNDASLSFDVIIPEAVLVEPDDVIPGSVSSSDREEERSEPDIAAAAIAGGSSDDEMPVPEPDASSGVVFQGGRDAGFMPGSSRFERQTEADRIREIKGSEARSRDPHVPVPDGRSTSRDIETEAETTEEMNGGTSENSDPLWERKMRNALSKPSKINKWRASQESGDDNVSFIPV